jgi:hypothetical protein
VPEGVEVEMPDTACAVLATASGDTCIRWCGQPAAVTRAIVHAALCIAGSWTHGRDGPPWLLDARHLGPNHWFFLP